MTEVVDLSDPPASSPVPGPAGVIVAVGDLSAATAEYWLQQATFTLTEDATDDPRAVRVSSCPDAVAELSDRVGHGPQAAAVCDDVLRAFTPQARRSRVSSPSRWRTPRCSPGRNSRAGLPGAARRGRR